MRRGEHHAVSSAYSLPVAVSHMTTSDSVRIVKGSWQNARQMAEYKRVWCCDWERSLPL